MIRRLRTTLLRIRLARLRVEHWAIRRLWGDDFVSREDALEDVEAEMRQLRFELRRSNTGWVFRSRQGDVRDTAAAMIPDMDEKGDPK